MTSSVLVALRIKAAPARVFDAFTRDISSWWVPNTLFRFTKGKPGRLAFEAGVGGRLTETSASGDVFEIGTIKVWKPGHALVFSWRQATFNNEQNTEVDVRFEPVGDETRVTVTHRGWDSVPADHVARHTFPDAIFLRRHAEWWVTLLDSLSGSCNLAPASSV